MRKLILLKIMIVFSTQLAYGYDNEITHRALTEKAISISSIGPFIRANLGSTEVASSLINGSTVLFWLKEGSYNEDVDVFPYCRRSTHFHNPLKSWDIAGASETSQTLFCRDYRSPNAQNATVQYSALTWATGYISKTGLWKPNSMQQMGWDNAKEYFYAALTSSTTKDRDDNFAKTFQAVGQVMHLLQDMAVPAHVRNDFWNSHILTGLSNPYELFAKQPDQIALLSSLTKEQTASVTPKFTRLTDFWDTTDGTVDIPPQIANPLLQPSAGLAEYTNANFVSEGTLFSNSTEFKHPAHSSTQEISYDIPDPFYPGSTVKRPYFVKATDWETGYHLAGVDYTRFYDPQAGTNPPVITPPMDDVVHKDYASFLLPRAVGYSAALLNYFFRGAIEITLPDNGVYAITEPGGSFTRIHLNARNTTTGERMTNGTIQLVVKYKNAQTDPIPSGGFPIDKEFSYLVVPESNNVTALSSKDQNEAPVELVFDLNPSLPLWTTDVYLQVVYRGELGNEADAVAVGFKDISEPTPFDIVNNMDHVCINGSYILADEAARAITDPAGKRIAESIDMYPHDLQDVYLAFLPQEATWPVQPVYSAYFAGIPNGNYGRVYILTEYTFKYITKNKAVRVDSRDFWSHGIFPHDPYVGSGLKNQTDIVNGTPEREPIPINLLGIFGDVVSIYAFLLTIVLRSTKILTCQEKPVLMHREPCITL